MKTPTLSDIRAHNIATGHHFFSRKTMKFFGDTMRTLHAVHEYGRVFVVRVKGRNAGKRWEYFAETGDVRTFTDAAPMYSHFDELSYSRRFSTTADFRQGDRVWLHLPYESTHAATVRSIDALYVHITLDASQIPLGVPSWGVVLRSDLTMEAIATADAAERVEEAATRVYQFPNGDAPDLTAEQVTALAIVAERWNLTSPITVHSEFCSKAVLVNVGAMWLGVEPDGYTHS